VAAEPHNAKCKRYFTPLMDGLVQSWDLENVWCNPPYSNIRPWVEKAWRSRADLVVMLLPANRTEQGWWQDLIEPERDHPDSRLSVRFLPGRPRFVLYGNGATAIRPNERPPFGLCLAIWS
jgi:phage N-6-adenine-methyltransferase